MLLLSATTKNTNKTNINNNCLPTKVKSLH